MMGGGLGDVCRRRRRGVWEKDGAMLWLSEFLHLPSRLTLIMFGGGLNRKMLPCLIMCLDNMCALLFFWVVVIFMLDRFSTKLGVFGLILIQRRRESYIPPRIPHTHSILGLSISSINPLRYSSVKNFKEPHSN